MMTTLALDPAELAYPTDLLELRFEIDGYARWDVDEPAPHLGVPIVYGSGACPHCGKDTGRLEVPLVAGVPQTTVVHCQRMRMTPWPHPCGGPISLVPILTEIRYECPRCGGHDHERLIVALDGQAQLLRCRGCGERRRVPGGDEVTTYAVYRGHNRRGNGAYGTMASAEVAGFVERCWRRGWRDLRVQFEGREIGRIEKLDLNGRRIWWAEELTNARPQQLEDE